MQRSAPIDVECDAVAAHLGAMRDLFAEIFTSEPLDPTEAARRAMRPQLRRRFYRPAVEQEPELALRFPDPGRSIEPPRQLRPPRPARGFHGVDRLAAEEIVEDVAHGPDLALAGAARERHCIRARHPRPAGGDVCRKINEFQRFPSECGNRTSFADGGRGRRAQSGPDRVER